MYVCVCLAVTDVEVKAAIEEGADHVDAVTSACKAGGDCGSCHNMIEDMIDEHARTSGCERRLPMLPNRPPREAA
ncbi:MAG: (2Fe-2S)-binding protein [Polyangiaceae bacterium]